MGVEPLFGVGSGGRFGFPLEAPAVGWLFGGSFSAGDLSTRFGSAIVSLYPVRYRPLPQICPNFSAALERKSAATRMPPRFACGAAYCNIPLQKRLPRQA